MGLPSNKLGNDILWSLGSFAILAVSGVLINLVVAGLRDPAALGVFNQTYAVYVVASQMAAFGLHYSVMRQSALLADATRERDGQLVNAAVFALVLGALAGLVVYAAAGLLGRLMQSEGVEVSLRYAAAGLALFPVNKVLLGYLNGLRRMKAFAVLQSVRYLALTGWITAVAASRLDFDLAAFAYLFAEALLFAGAVGYVLARRLVTDFGFDPAWSRRHLVFGGKSMLAGISVELNSRVDVLMIGYFLSDRDVGIYSFAAMLVDGMYQVLAVVRTNFNPLLVASLTSRDFAEARRLLTKSKRWVFPAAGAFAALLAASFWVLAVYLMPGKGLAEGLAPLAALLVGLTLVSSFIPFDNALLVSGHPGYQTLQHLSVVTSNMVFNAALVPVLGIFGSGLATALSYGVGAIVLIAMVNRLLRWNLVSNTVSS